MYPVKVLSRGIEGIRHQNTHTHTHTHTHNSYDFEFVTLSVIFPL